MPALNRRPIRSQKNSPAGVGQASREETAEYTKTGQDRRRAMGIWVVARLFDLTNKLACPMTTSPRRQVSK